MNDIRHNNKKLLKEVIVFVVITYLISWAMWYPAIIKSGGREVSNTFLFIGMFASFIPSMVGLLANRFFKGIEENKKYLKEQTSFGFDKFWLILIPGIFILINMTIYILLLRFGYPVAGDSSRPMLMMPLVFLQILFIGGALGEEFGWRGFAYPRLKQMMPPMIATLILGLVWSLWHLPLFFIHGTVQANMPIWQFMIQNTLMAYFYTWVYDKTKGNIILMIYLHAVANTSAAVLPYWISEQGRYTGLGVMVIGLLILYGWDKLRKINL